MPRRKPKPYWQTTDKETVRLYQGDVLSTLKKLPDNHVHCVVTSPPYWGLRDYGTDKSKELGSEKIPDCLGWANGDNCAEKDWDNGCHVCRMILVFREVRRVLRDDGTLWLNYGDTYSTGNKRKKRTVDTVSEAVKGRDGVYSRRVNQQSGIDIKVNRSNTKPSGKDSNVAFTPERYQNQGKQTGQSANVSKGNLVGVPWRVALGLQSDGWILRQDIIWNKPNPMPESVNNRCTKAHEYLFLFSKIAGGYFYDCEAIKDQSKKWNENGFRSETVSGDWINNNSKNNHNKGVEGTGGRKTTGDLSKNKRSVWDISTESYPGAHFATFPQRLIEPCIKAGTSEYGCCPDCGAPFQRVTQKYQLKRDRPNEYTKRSGQEGTGNSCANTVAGVDSKTLGWYPTCDCWGTEKLPKPPAVGGDYLGHLDQEGKNDMLSDDDRINKVISSTEYEQWINIVENLLNKHQFDTIPCTVLDPFIGSGTSCVVSLGLGRNSIGIDLSEDYLNNAAIPRIEGAIQSRPGLAHLIQRENKPVILGKKVN